MWGSEYQKYLNTDIFKLGFQMVSIQMVGLWAMSYVLDQPFVIYSSIWHWVHNENKFADLFGDVAFLVTKFPKEQLLVCKCRTEMMRNSEQYV